jgi:DNA-binding transcriptional LysR family regulator
VNAQISILVKSILESGMRFNFFQLEAFVATVDKGSFSSAARYLGKAQSAVSTAIMNLEVDLGIELFNREGNFPVLTEDGETLVRDVRQTLALASMIEDKSDGLSSGVEKKLTIAVEESIPWNHLVDLLVSFEKEFPHVELEFLSAFFDEAGSLIDQERADIGLIILESAPSLERNHRLVGRMKILPVVRADHSLAALEQVSLSDLRNYRQLLYTSRLGEPEREESQISANVWWLDSSYSTREVIRSGMAWGYLPAFMVTKDIVQGRLVPINIKQVDSEESLPIVLAWGEGATLGPAGRFLVDNFGQLEI